FQKSKIRSTEDGESLASCSDKEWDVADPAYGSELINLKKKPHKVTVFAAPRGKTIERTKIIKAEMRPEEIEAEDNANAIGRLCAEIVRIYLRDKKPSDVEVEVNLRLNKNRVDNIDITNSTSPMVSIQAIVIQKK
uniref:RanBD1 domain-containing protein n=1 Tax=Ascaris lumbricoides TaxID=6252 RepID=A0A0M3ITX4_ASCLU